MGGYDFEYFFGKHGDWNRKTQCHCCKAEVLICLHPVLFQDERLVAKVHEETYGECTNHYFHCPRCGQKNTTSSPPKD